ncbi:glycosyl transferase, group 1 family protein [Stigmatella aurantiaca DW4/3-1]|uniref:Glycosyl transferase, group 1 family protein n=1 Tax=Stigmatella aurantiaca (strain DW4/3-1) TaxID=378806 RepID=Q08TI7_STIAD|nr:glycosyl transferase, group 1 family protein [Stigmatella aurantiaca DW4/3-1]
MYELARGLAGAGCQITVLAYTPGQATVLREPNLTVHLIPPSRALLAQAAKLSLVRGVCAFNDELILHGRRCIAEERPDVIHFHQWHTHLSARQLGREFDIPVVGTSHHLSDPTERWWAQEPDPEMLEQERSFYDGSTPVITVAQAMRRLIHQTYGLALEKIHVTYCALDVTPFTQTPHSPETFARLKATVARPEDPIVLYTGRIHPQKGISAIFAAAERVLAKRPNVRFLLAGGTDSRQSTQMIHELCQRYAPLLGRIKLLGKVPRPQLALLHRIADIALVPSIFEPFPYTALEALASSRPLICTNTGGLGEVIEDGQSGLHVPIHRSGQGEQREVDVERLADAQLALLNDPERARRIALAGNRRLFERFSLKHMVIGNLDVYRQIAGMAVANPQSQLEAAV